MSMEEPAGRALQTSGTAVSAWELLRREGLEAPRHPEGLEVLQCHGAPIALEDLRLLKDVRALTITLSRRNHRQPFLIASMDRTEAMPASTATARVEYLLVIKAIRYVSREFGRIETDSPTQDGPITRRDIDRVVEAMHGVSTEVRALANHVVQAVQPSRRAQTASQGRDQDPDEDGDDEAEEAMAHMSGRRSKGLAKHRSSAQMKLHVRTYTLT